MILLKDKVDRPLMRAVFFYYFQILTVNIILYIVFF